MFIVARGEDKAKEGLDNTSVSTNLTEISTLFRDGEIALLIGAAKQSTAHKEIGTLQSNISPSENHDQGWLFWQQKSVANRKWQYGTQ